MYVKHTKFHKYLDVTLDKTTEVHKFHILSVITTWWQKKEDIDLYECESVQDEKHLLECPMMENRCK